MIACIRVAIENETHQSGNGDKGANQSAYFPVAKVVTGSAPANCCEVQPKVDGRDNHEDNGYCFDIWVVEMTKVCVVG